MGLFQVEVAMTQPGKIDDPFDASFGAWPEEPEDLGRKCRDLALAFTGLAFTPAAIIRILKDQFSTSARFARINYLFDGVRLKLKSLESTVGCVRDQTDKLRKRLDAPRFQQAFSTAAEEAARAVNPKRIDDFASVLVGSLIPNSWEDPQHDLATLIRDLAQLSESDLDVLRSLREVFGPVASHTPNFHDPNPFTERIGDLRTAIKKLNMHPDDFYSTCARLAGFGLALEELRNETRMHLSEHCYRPTRRGFSLLAYMDAAGGEAKRHAKSSRAKVTK
jgi:hypothetical protein